MKISDFFESISSADYRSEIEDLRSSDSSGKDALKLRLREKRDSIFVGRQNTCFGD